MLKGCERFQSTKKEIEVMDASLLNTVLSFVGVIFHNCMKVKGLKMKRSPLNITYIPFSSLTCLDQSGEADTFEELELV